VVLCFLALWDRFLALSDLLFSSFGAQWRSDLNRERMNDNASRDHESLCRARRVWHARR
jgi:hypothetical protein